jgi:hypothetical protein
LVSYPDRVLSAVFAFLAASRCAPVGVRGRNAAGNRVVAEGLIEFIEHLFVGPVWPASVLVCLLLLYTVIALLGLIDLDFGLGGEADIEAVGDVSAGAASVEGQPAGDLLGGAGAATLRWTNLRELPLVVWMSAFTVAFWAVSYGLWYGFDTERYEPTLLASSLLVARNAVIGVGITKVVTNPLKRFFVRPPAYGPATLIGRTCVVSSGEVSSEFGQARFATDAAPLLLNICTDGERLPKGTRVEIVSFDAGRRIYKVAAVPQEVSP